MAAEVNVPAEGLNLIGYQNAITAYVESLYVPLGFDVIEDTLEDDRVFYRDTNGKSQKYIVLRYGPLLVKRNGKAMAGVRHDEYVATVDVIAVSPDGNGARMLCNAVWDDLLGWSPDGVSKITLRDDGGAANAFVVASNEARPTRNTAAQRLQFTVNAKNVGARLRDALTP